MSSQGFHSTVPSNTPLGVHEFVDQLRQLDEKVSENRKVGIVLGEFTVNYTVVLSVIRSQSDLVLLCAPNHLRSLVAWNIPERRVEVYSPKHDG